MRCSAHRASMAERRGRVSAGSSATRKAAGRTAGEGRSGATASGLGAIVLRMNPAICPLLETAGSILAITPWPCNYLARNHAPSLLLNPRQCLLTPRRRRNAVFAPEGAIEGG